MDRLTLVRGIFSADRYATELTGIEITSLGTNEAVCTLTVDERHRNARGAVMGGALFTLADFATAVAANSSEIQKTDTELHWVSLDASVHYLSPAVGNKLTARSTAIKHGRTTALYQTAIDCDGRTVAMVETTMVRI